MLVIYMASPVTRKAVGINKYVAKTFKKYTIDAH